MELTNEVYDAVTRYFSALSHMGYKSYAEVDQLLVFTFIEELLYGPLSQFITEEDYKVINDSLYCLYGSCMMPFPEYKKSFTPTAHKMLEEYRVSEIGIFRTDGSGLRVKS